MLLSRCVHLNFYLVRAAAALVFTFYLTACGGGGGAVWCESGSTPASAPPATNPASEPTRLAVLDSVPQGISLMWTLRYLHQALLYWVLPI